MYDSLTMRATPVRRTAIFLAAVIVTGAILVPVLDVWQVMLPTAFWLGWLQIGGL